MVPLDTFAMYLYSQKFSKGLVADEDFTVECKRVSVLPCILKLFKSLFKQMEIVDTYQLIRPEVLCGV